MPGNEPAKLRAAFDTAIKTARESIDGWDAVMARARASCDQEFAAYSGEFTDGQLGAMVLSTIAKANPELPTTIHLLIAFEAMK